LPPNWAQPKTFKLFIESCVFLLPLSFQIGETHVFSQFTVKSVKTLSSL
jgi:hypothetical protein